MSLNPQEQHEKANAELWKHRDKRHALADSLYARHEKNPGSVPQSEWNKLKQMDATSRRMQDNVGRLAQKMLRWQYEESQKALQERQAEAAKLLESGDSVATVAEKMGLSTSTIYKYRRQIKADVDADAADKASGKHRMPPSKSATVAAVGEHAYKSTLRGVPSGEVWVELIPEPDNPHDPNAISVRYNGSVIAYIPKERTSRYRDNVCRIVASGRTPLAKAKVYHGANDFHEVSLFLLAGDRGLGSDEGLIPKATTYEVPNSFQGPKTGAPIPAPKSATPPTPFTGAPRPSDVVFTDAEYKREEQRRRLEREKRDRERQKVAAQAQNSGCMIIAVLVVCVPLLVLFI